MDFATGRPPQNLPGAHERAGPRKQLDSTDEQDEHFTLGRVQHVPTPLAARGAENPRLRRVGHRVVCCENASEPVFEREDTDPAAARQEKRSPKTRQNPLIR